MSDFSNISNLILLGFTNSFFVVFISGFAIWVFTYAFRFLKQLF